MQIVSRSGGSRGLLPYETAGLKDTVFLTPGEVVHVLAYYGPWNGLYMVGRPDLFVLLPARQVTDPITVPLPQFGT